MTEHRFAMRLAAAGMALAVALLTGCQPTIGGGTTRRISDGINGSWTPSVSADGRFVAYTSEVSGDPGGWRYTQVFLWDRRTNRTMQLTDGDNGSHYPTVSAHGEVVAFQSYAENLVPVVNSKWLEANPKAEDALNELSAALTTDDLKELNAKVDGERQEASTVAEEFLKEKGLV